MSADTPALVLGAAACLPDDVAALHRICGGYEGWTILAANDGGVWWPGRLDWWCTIHMDELPERERRRREAGYPDGYRVVGEFDVPPELRIDGGGSAFVAVAKAYARGHRRIVLAGCPMDGQGYALPHMHHGTGPWPFYATYQQTVPSQAKQKPWLVECCRSMSGFTRDLFGAPTAEWLACVG